MCTLIDILQWKKKIEKDSDNFWYRKLTLNVKRLGDFALFGTSPLTQFSKFNNFLWVCWFLGKNLSNFVPPFENSTTRIAITIQIYCLDRWEWQWHVLAVKDTNQKICNYLSPACVSLQSSSSDPKVNIKESH